MDVSIVANGTVRSGAWLRKSVKGIIVAADGGANTCRTHRIIPDYIIGDFDSITKGTLAAFKKTSTILREPDQDATDLQKALALARMLGAARVFVFGAIGSALDHTIANVLTLDTRCIMRDETHDIMLVTRKAEIQGTPGDIVSVIALTAVRGLSYTGLTWSVKNRSVPAGWLGVRNRLIGKRGSITLKKGTIAVIRTKP